MDYAVANTKQITVFHSCIDWLPQTQTWIYSQIIHLPSWIDNHVLCERTVNLDQFNIPHLHSLCKFSRQQCMIAKGLRKLHIRKPSVYFQRQLADYHGDILHSHFGDKGWEDQPLARSNGLKHVVTFYGVDVNHLPAKEPRWRSRYKELFQSVDAVLCEGPYMARSIVQLGCSTEKVHVHHLGVNVDDIVFQPLTWHPGQPLKVLIAAAFRQKKGIPYALEALGRLKGQINLEITIIGDASSYPRSQREKQVIMETIERYGLVDRVRLLGFQPYAVLTQAMYNHHIFLSPSVLAQDGDSEGGAPVTIIEAAAAGLLVVSTTHCDIPEVILNGETGLLAPERDVDALVAHLQWLVTNEDAWDAIRQAARTHIEKEFNAKIQGDRLAMLYQELIHQ